MKVAVVGAVGLVGTELMKLLAREEHLWSDLEVVPFGRGSAGSTVNFKGSEIEVKHLRELPEERWDVIFLMADETASEYVVESLREKGKLNDTIVIDNSSRYRLEEGVPLVVPEVNGNLLRAFSGGLIANPNCSTVQLVVPLAPLHDVLKVRRVMVATYQSISGAGHKALNEFRRQIRGDAPSPGEPQYAYNLIPQIGDIDSRGLCKEERKMIYETEKILSSGGLEKPLPQVVPFTVRVPVIRGHSQAVFVETESDCSLDEFKGILGRSPGVKLFPEDENYPMPAYISGSTMVHIGRVRKDDKGIFTFWSVFDNLMKGAAYNAYQIAKEVLGIGERILTSYEQG